MPRTATLSVRRTVADLIAQLGDIPPDRIRLTPTPGTATEEDLLAVLDQEGLACELVDAVLVEKAMGLKESFLASALIFALMEYLKINPLGLVGGEQGTVRLFPGQVRIPDVAFYAWERFPGGEAPSEPIPDLAPDLAVEILSDSNTKKEMGRKLRDYFKSGVRLVWYADPDARTVRVFTSVRKSILLDESRTLDGGDVLPGFRLSVKDWFASVKRQGPTAR